MCDVSNPSTINEVLKSKRISEFKLVVTEIGTSTNQTKKFLAYLLIFVVYRNLGKIWNFPEILTPSS